MGFGDRLRRYPVAVSLNVLTYAIPAVYSTLSKFWVAQIDYSMVATSDTYTYMGIVAEIFNEGLPRASFRVIGDEKLTRTHRLKLVYTLLLTQMVVGVLLSIAFLAAAPAFCAAFAPDEIRAASAEYVRISAFSIFCTCIDYALATAMRAFDRPDVPLIISLSKIVVNIALDFAVLSPWRLSIVGNVTANTQASVRLVCDLMGTIVGLAYFMVCMVV